MSILDDAIREHLELKRAHGADATELKKLEDEAFGPPARPDEPDPLAEAPTEFLTPEGAEGGSEAAAEPAGRRVPNIADLQEAPEPREGGRRRPRRRPPRPRSPRLKNSRSPRRSPRRATRPGSARRSPNSRRNTSTSRPRWRATGEVASPSDEELVDAEISEPRLAPVDPLAEERTRRTTSSANSGSPTS